MLTINANSNPKSSPVQLHYVSPHARCFAKALKHATGSTASNPVRCAPSWSASSRSWPPSRQRWAISTRRAVGRRPAAIPAAKRTSAIIWRRPSNSNSARTGRITRRRSWRIALCRTFIDCSRSASRFSGRWSFQRCRYWRESWKLVWRLVLIMLCNHLYSKNTFFFLQRPWWNAFDCEHSVVLACSKSRSMLTICRWIYGALFPTKSLSFIIWLI